MSSFLCTRKHGNKYLGILEVDSNSSVYVSSDPQGFVPLGTDPGRSERGVRSKREILGYGGVSIQQIRSVCASLADTVMAVEGKASGRRESAVIGASCYDRKFLDFSEAAPVQTSRMGEDVSWVPELELSELMGSDPRAIDPGANVRMGLDLLKGSEPWFPDPVGGGKSTGIGIQIQSATESNPPLGRYESASYGGENLTPSTGFTSLVSLGIASGYPDLFEVISGGRYMGSHVNRNASAGATAKRDGDHTTPMCAISGMFGYVLPISFGSTGGAAQIRRYRVSGDSESSILFSDGWWSRSEAQCTDWALHYGQGCRSGWLQGVLTDELHPLFGSRFLLGL